MSTHDFDLIVIGGGSGGLAGAFRAAEHGAKVALMEPQALGGTCVNVGCVPKKAMWFAAELAGRLQQARALGFAVPDAAPLDWTELLLRRGRYIDGIHRAYRERLETAGITVLPHRGRLTGMPGEVVCGSLQWRAAHLLIATGSESVRPDLPGADMAATSDDFFALQDAPERVAVVGGGYIGVELASLLQGLGSRVAMFVRGDRLLEGFDAELTERLADAMTQAGVKLQFGTSVDRLAKGDAGGIDVVTGEQVHADFDMALFAIGRRANTAGLGLDAAGVRCGERGRIVVDDWQNTSRPDTYAVGDVTAQPALTPYAIAAARRLMDRLFGGQPDSRVRFEQVPTAVFSHPPLAALGLTEAQARERHGEAVRVYRAGFRPMLAALADHGPRSVFKVVCAGSDERVVGLHLLGEGADEILQGFAVAMHMGMTVADLQATLAIHPTSAEEVVLIRS
ncbi:MAG: glutathione-disulfide reductase [Pseudoxanthomonas suwonensis]|nr:glutathione-disulfide reductase [Pseudoxanthomonas suwonensis]